MQVLGLEEIPVGQAICVGMDRLGTWGGPLNLVEREYFNTTQIGCHH